MWKYRLIVEQYITLKSILICVEALNLIVGITKYVAFVLVRVRFRCVLYPTVLLKVAKELECLHVELRFSGNSILL